MVLLRAAAVLAIDALALLLLAELLPGFTLDGPGAALAAALAVGAVNALVWPALALFTLRLSVLTLGSAAIVLNAILVTAVIDLIPDAEISGLGEGIVVTVGLSVLTALFSALLAIGDHDAWYRNVVLRRLKRGGKHVRSSVPGVLFLEIDGLAHEIVTRALRDGTTPHLARWVAEGSHRLERWETDLSSQTGACQAGLLHGNNEDMPAFRWWEKDSGRAIVSNHPGDAAELERRISDGRGLLHSDGASRANILSGDAPHSMLTMSTALTRRRPLGADYAAYFAQPYATLKTAGGALADYLRERHYAASQRRRDVHPRIKRDRRYALLRAWATTIQLDLQVATVVGDVLSGRPLIYTTFLAYDEVAHHSGIERVDSLEVLAKVDHQIGRIASALADAPRPYRIVVLSDHGQSQGATFRQRYGQTLEEVVTEACEKTTVRAESGGEDEASAYLGAGLTELRRDKTATARGVRAMTRRRLDDGAVQIPASSSDSPDDGDAAGDQLPELSIMASGCLGLISFPRERGRVPLERIERLHPRLVPALVGHPGIGFVMARSEERGAVVLGSGGRRWLGDDRVEGADPLADFGSGAADHLRRTDGFTNCPDLLLNSSYWPETGEVAAFEELVGSHGGIGGPQSHPFVLRPAELSWPDQPVVGAEAVHRVLRGWLEELGHEGYADNGGEDPRGD
jgi:uncharacterized membrane protein YvlD (DUF360 family)